MRASSRDDGFTLMEVLAALTILSVSVLGLLGSTRQAVSTTSEIELLTLANIVADNRITMTRTACGGTGISSVNDLLDCVLDEGRDAQDGREEVLGRTFDWRVERLDTPDERIDEIVTTVAYEDRTILTRRTFLGTTRNVSVTVVDPPASDPSQPNPPQPAPGGDDED